MMKIFILLSSVLLMFSCNSDDDNSNNYCTEEFVYGLKVTLKDAVTSAIVTEGIIVTAKDGSYEEQLMNIQNSDYFIGAGERDGTYIIEISSNDFQMFKSNNVVVEKTEDDCQVITKELEIVLQPI